MTKSLPVLLKTTLGAQVSPSLAQEGRWGSASTPFSGVHVVPLGDVDTWTLMVWLGTAKFCVAKA